MSRQQLIEQTARQIMSPGAIMTQESCELLLRRLISFTEAETDAEVELALDPINTMALRWCKVLTGESRVGNVEDMLLAYTGQDGSKACYITRDEKLQTLMDMVTEWGKE